MLGFCGGGGTPLFAGTEQVVDVAWFSPQSEYRPTEYLQQWVRFWFDDALRLDAARGFQQLRLTLLRQHWLEDRALNKLGFVADAAALDALIGAAKQAIQSAPDHMILMTEEARMTKLLYQLACKATGYGDFTRAKRGEGVDLANQFLDHGNYLAYGLGATATWVLGLPHGLAVLHGKTRRGGLVFDVADLVKDALILPQAFLSANLGHTEQEFRSACIASLVRAEALDFMIDALKRIALQMAQAALVRDAQR